MRNILLSLLFCVVVTVTADESMAAAVTWTGGGIDNLASTAANWSGGRAPQDGDEAVFDAASSKDCVWDLEITLASFSLTAGYTGAVTISANLAVSKSIIWTGGGADNLASTADNWSGGITPQNGDNIVFNESTSKDCIWDINVTPALFSVNSAYTGTVALNNDLTINGRVTVSGGFFNLNNKNLNADGGLTIGNNGTLYATSSVITLTGDWIKRGTFIPGTSTVILGGTNQGISGDTTFYNLTKIAASADTLYFQAGSTQTIINSLTLQGADSSNLLSLRSTVDGQQWFIDPRGTGNIYFASMKDLYNLNFVNIAAISSEDTGNNSGVSFGGDECVCLFELRVKSKEFSSQDSGVRSQNEKSKS